MDFDFTTETITPDNTNVLTIGGNGGLELPIGNTAGRPGSPANGLIRYNTDTGQLEGFFSNVWTVPSMIANQVTVQKNPGAGQFGSIAEAVASITTASATQLWQVYVSPGIYTEPEIVIPPYVYISGIGQYEIMVEPDSNDHHLFVMSENTSISFLQIRNVGTGYAGIVCENVGSYALCHKVSMTDCGIGWLISATDTDSIVYLEYCDAADGDTGISISSANGFSQSVNLENFYIYGNPTHGLEATGPDTSVNLQAFGFEGEDGTGHGIHVQDGASIAAKAGHIYGWNFGTHISDTGDPSEVQYLGVEIQGNTTWDFKTDHPLCVGTLVGTARRQFVDANSSPNFTFAYSDPEENGYIQTGNFFMGQTPGTLTDVTDLIIETPPTGLITGGAMSIVSGLTLGVTAGHGYLRKDGRMTKVEWAGQNIVLPANSLPYVYIDNNATIQYSASLPNTVTTIFLGRAGTNATNIYTLGPLYVDINNYGNKVEDYLRLTVGPVFVSGSIVSENQTTPRAIDVTAGNWYYGTQHRLPSAKTAPSITDVYKSSGNLTFSSITQIPNDTYDNGTNLVSLTTGYFTKHVLYQASEGIFQAYTLVHGQAEYATQDEALDAPLPTSYIDPGPTPKIAAIIVQQGVNSLVEIIDVRPLFFNTSGGSGSMGTNIHGDLLGLDADDHPQYLLVDGTRAMAGDLSMGTNDITNIGTLNGVTIEAHAARHLPNGADPITTAAAVGLNASSTNTAGIANSLARSDHTHQITGFQPLDATLTALAGYNTNGILTQTAADTFTGRTITGTASRISVTNGNGVSGNPTIDIDSGYVGQTSITTLGTIGTGTWNGTTIGATFGGTGLNTYAVGDLIYANSTTTLARLADVAAGSFLRSGGVGTAPAWSTVTLPNSATTGDLLYASASNIYSNLADVAIGNALISGGVGTAPSWGKIGLTTHVSGTLGIGNGGTGVTSTPTNGQLLIGNGTGYSVATLTQGTGINITNGAGTITIASTATGTVTSVGLALPSIFNVSGSPVTTTGTLTGTLATQTANTFFAGPASGGAATPTFRTVGIDELSDVVITTPSTNQVIAYNGSNWVNTGAVGANASGLIGVGQAGAAAWALVSGNRYQADFVHNLGTTNVVVTVWDTSDNSTVIPQSVVTTSNTTVRVTVTGNTKTLKVVVVANGQSIVAGGSTPSSVITAKDGVTVSTAATRLNFVGPSLGVTDAGSGTTNIVFGARFTFFAASLDTPVNSDFAVNSLAPMVADPTYPSLNVRQFSNTTEQGVAFLVSIPSGVTTMTVKIRGRAQAAPGVASVVQPRLYYRLLPNNSAVGAWSAAQELANISIPTNANFQYGTQTINLSTLGLTAGNLYQIEMTRRTSGVTGTNLATNFLMAELTVEFA